MPTTLVFIMYFSDLKIQFSKKTTIKSANKIHKKAFLCNFRRVEKNLELFFAKLKKSSS